MFQRSFNCRLGYDRTIWSKWYVSKGFYVFVNVSLEIVMRKGLFGHRAAVNVVDFDERYIVSASGDRTIKVWTATSCEFVRTLQGHRRGIGECNSMLYHHLKLQCNATKSKLFLACLQYRENIVVSGSSDNSIRIWDIEHGTCLRTLEGHEELVRCIRFDNKRIVSGAYDGKYKLSVLNLKFISF